MMLLPEGVCEVDAAVKWRFERQDVTAGGSLRSGCGSKVEA